MKKIIPVFISLVLVISLCACSAGGKSVKFTPKLNEPFVVTAKIQYGDQESDAVFRKYGKANWDIEFSAPNTLAGVILSYRDDKVDASYKGLSFSVPKTALPVKSIISSFIEVVDSAADQAELEAVEKEESMIVEGELEQGKYTLKLDKNGGITGFDMPNLELKIVFSEFHADSSDVPDMTQMSGESEVPTESEAQTVSETAASSESASGESETAAVQQ